MKKTVLLFVIFSITKSLSAQITWSGEIASIIYTNCSNCHNTHGIAPFVLMNYNDALLNANDIESDVQGRIMPPWPPDINYSHLAHERILSQQQINDISSWVDNGSPRGDSTLEPPAPVFNSNSQISNPDLVLSAPVYQVNTMSGDVYRCFVITSGLLTDKYLTALEAVPGDRSVVHHILIYSDSTSTPASLDAADPGPGYTNFGGTGSNASKLIGVWVPGQSAYYTPNGMGIKLEAHTNIILQVHYPAGISNKTDSSKIYLKLTSSFQREITIEPVLNHYQLDNGPLIIPANTIRTFTAHYLVPYDISLLGVGPHMHLIGKSIFSFGITSTNDTIPFVDIPDWDFHWQGVYSFPKVLKIPAGTTIYSSATYDNTSANVNNPNSPPRIVTLGEATTNEMMLVYFAYTNYFPGDENIIIDSTLLINNVEPISNSAISTPQLYEPSPNPSSGNITYQYYLPAAMTVQVSILDLAGKLIEEENATEVKNGLVTSRLDISGLPSGIYFLNLKAGGVIRSKKFVKN